MKTIRRITFLLLVVTHAHQLQLDERTTPKDFSASETTPYLDEDVQSTIPHILTNGTTPSPSTRKDELSIKTETLPYEHTEKAFKDEDGSDEAGANQFGQDSESDYRSNRYRYDNKWSENEFTTEQNRKNMGIQDVEFFADKEETIAMDELIKKFKREISSGQYEDTTAQATLSSTSARENELIVETDALPSERNEKAFKYEDGVEEAAVNQSTQNFESDYRSNKHTHNKEWYHEELTTEQNHQNMTEIQGVKFFANKDAMDMDDDLLKKFKREVFSGQSEISDATTYGTETSTTVLENDLIVETDTLPSELDEKALENEERIEEDVVNQYGHDFESYYQSNEYKSDKEWSQEDLSRGRNRKHVIGVKDADFFSSEMDTTDMDDDLLKIFKREVFSGHYEDQMEIRSIKRMESELRTSNIRNWNVLNFSGKLLICYENEAEINLVLMSPTFQVIFRHSVPGQGPCHFIPKSQGLLFIYTNSGQSSDVIVSKLTLGLGEISTKLIQILPVTAGSPKFTSWYHNKNYFLMITSNAAYSRIYIWKNKKFEIYQTLHQISSEEAHHFLIGSDSYVSLTGLWDDTDGKDARTTIYKYFEWQQKYTSYQELPIPAVSHLNAFTIGEEVFLAGMSFCKQETVDFCNPNTNSPVFKYNGKEFELFQSIGTSGAIKSSIIKFEKEEFLVVLNSMKGLAVYRYDGKFVEIFPHVDKPLLEDGLTDLKIFENHNEILIGVRSLHHSSSGLMFYTVNFEPKHIAESKLDQSKLVETCLYAMKLLNTKVEETKRDVQEALKNRPIYFERNPKIQTHRVDSELGIPAASSKLYDGLSGEIDRLEREMSFLEQSINRTEEQISNAINITETTTWPDNLHMSSIVILVADIDELAVQYVNGLPVPTTDELIPFDQSNLHLNLNTKTFSDIEIQNLKVENLNGFPISSYLTLSGDHVTSAQFTFNHLSTPRMKIGGLIDGIDLVIGKVLTKTSGQPFHGSLLCSDITVVDLETDFINGVNVRKLMKNSVQNYSPRIFDGDLKIAGDLILQGDLVSGSVLGRDLNALAEDILLLNSTDHQVITGHYTIESVKVPDLYLTRNLNSIHFWDSVFINLPIKLYHVPKATFDHLNAKQITVDKSLNKIKVIGQELDVVTLGNNQVISGPKIFKEIHLGNSMAYESVQGFNTSSPFSKINYSMQEFYHSGLISRDFISRITSDLKHLNLIRVHLLKLSYTKPISLRLSLISQNSKAYQTISRTLEKLIPRLEELNDYLENDLESAKEIVPELKNENDLAKLNELSLLKNVPVTLLNLANRFYDKLDTASQTTEKAIYSKKRSLSAASDTLDENDRHLQEELEKYNLGGIPSRGSIVTGKTAGLDLRKIVSSRRSNIDTLDKNIILDKIMNADSVIFMKNLETQVINDVEIDKLLQQAVPIHSTQTNLSLVFEDGVMVQNDLTVPYFNDHFTSHLATVHGTNVFEKEIEFQSIRSQNDVEIEGKVNGLNINKLSSDIATVSGLQTFQTPVAFTSVIANSVDASIVILGNTSLDDIVLKRDTDILITGRKEFRGLSITGPLVTIKKLETKKLGPIDLEESALKREVIKDMKITGRKELQSLIVNGNIDARRDLQSIQDSTTIDLSRIYHNAVIKDEPVILTGSLILKGNVNAEELIFKSSFDGVTADELASGWVKQDSIQVLHGSNMFKNLNVKNLHVMNNMIQGVNLKDLVEKTAKVDEDNSFQERVYMNSLTSLKPIEVSGLVQGWNLTRDAVLVSDSPVIYAPKEFLSPVKVKGDTHVKGFVNGMNLGAICKSVLGELVIKGSVHFDKDVRAKKVQSGDYIVPDDDSSYWMIDRPATFNSDIVFDSITSKSVYIKNKFNGEAIKTILEGPVSKDCKTNAPLGKWTAETLTCGYLKTHDMTVKKFGDEDSKILDKLIINTIDQVFPEELNIAEIEVTDSLYLRRLNGFYMSDFCMSGSYCRIEASKTFSSLTVQGDWNIGEESFVNDYSVSNLKNLSSSIFITVFVNGPLQVPTLRVNGLVNGINFDPYSIMSLTRDQVMSGSLFITNRGKLALKAADVQILEGKFNDLNVSSLELYKDKTNLTESNGKMKSLLKKYKELEHHITDVHSVLQEQHVSFDGWAFVETFDGYDHIVPLENFEDSFLPFLVVFNSENVHLVHHSSAADRSRYYATIRVNCPTGISGFRMDNELYVAVSVGCPNDDMNLNGVSLVSPETMTMDEKIFSYIWKMTSNGPSLHTAVATGKSSQVLWLKVSGRNCILFASRTTTRQNIICEDKTTLILQQSLNIGKVIKAVHVEVEDSEEMPSFLIIGTEGKLREVSYVQILKFNWTVDHYYNMQTIQAEGLTWLTAINFWNSVFLITVHESFGPSIQGTIRLYKLETTTSESKFQLQESFKVTEPIQATLMRSPTDELYLLVLIKNGYVRRYVRRRFGKFHSAGFLDITNGQSLLSWTWKFNNGYNLAISIKDAKNSKVILLKPRYKGLLDTSVVDF